MYTPIIFIHELVSIVRNLELMLSTVYYHQYMPKPTNVSLVDTDKPVVDTDKPVVYTDNHDLDHHVM